MSDYTLPTDFLFTSFLELNKKEVQRIIDHNLATADQIQTVIGQEIEGITKRARDHRNRDDLINELANMHRFLSSIKIPGDFDQYITKAADISANSSCKCGEYCYCTPECECGKDDGSEIKEASIAFLTNLKMRLDEKKKYASAYLVDKAIKKLL